ncbi:17834_t:CDS:2 [Funneliformis geosporum]|nr:17834_t:CDS:2 [Funneliformis geosporum]
MYYYLHELCPLRILCLENLHKEKGLVDSRRKRKDAISTAPKTVIATRERERASCARGGGRGHGKRKTVTEAISFVPNTFQNDFDKTTDNLDHKRNRVYTTLSSLKNDHVASDFSDDLNSNFDDFGRNASVIITKLTKKSNPLNKRTKKTGVTNLLLSDSEEETDFNDRKEIAKHYNKKSRKPEAFKDMTNALEICQWLVKRSKILTMAYQMYNMCRESSDEAIKDFIKEIFNYDLFSDNSEEVSVILNEL